MQHRRLYNMPVMQAAVADSRSRESTRAPRMVSARWAALAVVAIVGAFAIRLGAGPDLEDHRTGPFAFEAPAAWSVTDARAVWTGGSSYAVIGTAPIPASCLERHFDINCYLDHVPPPSSVSILLLNQSGILQVDDTERPPVEGTRMEIGGLEAYRIDHEIAPNDYYRSDVAVSWVVPYSEANGGPWVIDAKVRGPGAGELLADVERLVASMRIEP